MDFTSYAEYVIDKIGITGVVIGAAVLIAILSLFVGIKLAVLIVIGVPVAALIYVVVRLALAYNSRAQ